LDSESEYFTGFVLKGRVKAFRIILTKVFSMRIILAPTFDEAISTVSAIILEKISSHPKSVIGLATGKTMEPVYESWIAKTKEEGIKHEEVFFFMLDDYLNLPPRHSGSFRSYIEERLLKPLKLASSQFSFPPVHHDPIEEAANYYEKLIKESGGVDLQLLGIGKNGHIGFNEPGSLKSSRTRKVQLTEETIAANQVSFQSEEMPREALSMGIGTILESKSLLMLATGKSKADAIKYLVNHHDDPSCPATYLKSHPYFTLVLDPEAASKISLKI
jgi:glucosamine-6-phosphate deaminase